MEVHGSSEVTMVARGLYSRDNLTQFSELLLRVILQNFCPFLAQLSQRQRCLHNGYVVNKGYTLLISDEQCIPPPPRITMYQDSRTSLGNDCWARLLCMYPCPQPKLGWIKIECLRFHYDSSGFNSDGSLPC